MRIAVSVESENGLESKVAHHFGRCPYFALVDVVDENIQSCKLVANPYYSAHQPGQVPGFIKEQGADVMLSGGMGRRAIQFFESYEIQAATGAQGDVQEAIQRYLGGELSSAAPCRESVEHEHARGHQHKHDKGHRH